MEGPVETFSATAAHLLDGYRRSSDGIQRWYASLLKHLCRELEDFAPLNVSERARDEGVRHGIRDLRRYHWDQQTRFDEKRAVFHWEHLVPVNDLFRALVDLRDPDTKAIAGVLRTATVVWILKKEDKKLTELGERHGRDNPLAAYEKAGIQLVYRSCGSCERGSEPYECPVHEGRWPPRLT
jgi:hypothetical protein